MTIAGTLLGPSLRSVWAQSDENAAAYWRSERARQSRPAVAPTPQLQPRVSAYAPAQQSLFSGLRVPPIFRAGLPGGPERNLAGAAEDERKLQRKAMPAPSQAAKRTDTPAVRLTSGAAVCVRLCDGFHFPAGSPGVGTGELEASCNAQCPGAPTRVYYSRSDRIEDAVAARTGKRYSTLPVALRYASTRDNTCTCRTDGLPGLQTTEIYRDRTLRRGDPVMTEAGFRIFKGSDRWPYRPRDFVPLQASNGLVAAPRSVLSSLERASGVVRRSPAVQQATPVRSRADASATAPVQGPILPVPLVRIPDGNGTPRAAVRMIGPQALYSR